MTLLGRSFVFVWVVFVDFYVSLTLCSPCQYLAFCQAAGFDLFTNASFPVLLILFSLFGAAMVCLAFLLSTLISSSSTAQTFGCVRVAVLWHLFECVR